MQKIFVEIQAVEKENRGVFLMIALCFGSTVISKIAVRKYLTLTGFYNKLCLFLVETTYNSTKSETNSLTSTSL